ncbi:MAG: LLM class F420-dependent oxidoreductase [Segniliparus sp.]|uniref:LLM class F420-dependent oxidoreductase n=1 Tax=Segniliparus sp. TaxID=2804064 RepID=UPI003F3C2FEB
MARKIRIGVQLQQQHAHDYHAIRDAVSRAEDAGVDVIFNWDHFYPLHGDPDGTHFGDGWTLLAAWAEQTSHVELGVLVTCLGYRNPDLLADIARTVDHISGGRVVLGVGAGWFEKDYDEYGYEFGTAGSRLGLFADSLDRVKARLTKLNPPPVGPLPILIGGSGERKTLREVAKHADIWHSFLPLPEFVRKSAVLEEHGAAVGRDVSQIERSMNWPGSGSTVIKAVDPAQAPSVADDFLAAGVTLFTVGVGGPDYDFTTLNEALRWRDANS